MADQVVMMKRVAKVWDGDEQCEITVEQKLKSVWIAVGQYMGKEVRVQGRTANNASALWRDSANSRIN
jgi:hypothetical protein